MIAKIRNNVFIGNYQEAEDVIALTEQGITACLNVAYEVNDPVAPPEMMIQVKVGLMDSGDNPPYAKALAVSTLIDLLQSGQKVFVHCAAGLSRAPYVVAKALGELEDKDPDQIWQDIRNERPFVMKGALWNGEGYKPVDA